MKTESFYLVEFHEIDLIVRFEYNYLWNSTKIKKREGVNVLVICFIGHRNIKNAEQIKSQFKEIVTALISSGADTFLFGSRSDFDYICWSVVTELKVRFPNIKRIKYNVPHEVAFTSKKERERFERIYSNLTHKEVLFTDYEESVDCASHANMATYIMRNQKMIDNSDICVFYYDKNYLPPKRKQSKKQLCDYQPKSGTAIAYKYAIRKENK